MASWLPGWNSIESVSSYHRFFEIAGLVSVALMVVAEVLSFVYGQREDTLASIQGKERSVAIQNLRAELEKTRQTVNTDHNLKNRLRHLFSLIDPQILRTIDGGQFNLTIRMQPSDITALKKLLAEPDGEKLVTIKGYGRECAYCTIINGTLGPQGSVPLQTEVMLDVFPAMKEEE